MPFRLAAALCAAFLATAMPAVALASPEGRVIVKFRSDAKVLEKAALQGANGTARGRADALGRRMGLALAAGHEIAERVQVVRAQGVSSESLAQALAADPDVEFAVPDRRRRLRAAPNDPLYGAGVAGTGPAAGQWYLRAPQGEVVSSINAEAAWNVTSGSPGIVVAVVDTGVRFEHPDLQRAVAGGNLLPGYDMIADSAEANDGDGRDADASDPGTWLTQAEVNAGGSLAGCDDFVGDSSWHGTQVSGLIAALTDNGTGMASVGRNVRVLPVRVVGKCGGWDSEIIAGMRWAAGLVVPGVPMNGTPARVINLSLGGEEACTSGYRSAVAEITAAGTVIVAAAGNDAGHVVGVPGNCDGVIAVAGLRHAGTKVGFSSLGAEVAVAAPGGNCVNTAADSPCLYPILTTSNAGTTTPGASIYTDAYNISVGTSFSSPLVAGTVALMLSARPSLTPAQVRAILQGTSRPFPTRSADPSIPVCRAPQPMGSTQVDQLECLCTTTTCGAGMVDAGAAVAAAQAGVQTANVIEYYHASLDHYFITWQPNEIAVLDAGTAIRGWTRTGRSFRVYTTPEVGTTSVCRYYIPPGLGDSHFYGRGGAECEPTGSLQQQFVLEEGRFMHMRLPSGGTCPAGMVPVYRVFSNRPDANHRYMTDAALRDQMVSRGWLAEGDGPDRVVMCGPQ